MKGQEYVFRLASFNYLNKRVDRNLAKLNKLSIADDMDKRMKIHDENLEILKAMIWKRRKDKTFVNRIQSELSRIVKEAVR